MMKISCHQRSAKLKTSQSVNSRNSTAATEGAISATARWGILVCCSVQENAAIAAPRTTMAAAMVQPPGTTRCCMSWRSLSSWGLNSANNLQYLSATKFRAPNSPAVSPRNGRNARQNAALLCKSRSLELEVGLE
jgi:hypothetical protein